MSRARTHHHTAKKHRVMVVKKASNTHVVDRLTYGIAILEPLITLPQVYAIWNTKDASGVSISSWAGYWIFGIIWLWYGIVHKDKAIITYNSLYLGLECLIVIGAIMYGGHW